MHIYSCYILAHQKVMFLKMLTCFYYINVLFYNSKYHIQYRYVI